MKTMCQKIVQPHWIFDYSNVFLETQRFSGKCDKREGKLLFKIRLDSVHIGFKPLIFMPIDVQMQPTFGVEVSLK